jgi:type IV secretion system protein TrbE
MQPSQHSIPIHRAANRPVLVLGCDRELIGLVIGSSLALIWIGQTWTSVGYGVFLFLFSLGVLRLAAKADPYMRQVYMRSRHYKKTYLARSTPFVDTPKRKNGSLSPYRSRAPGFVDLLNWAAVPEDGIVLGKDGSLMAGWVYEGEDEASRTDEEQALVSFRINEALKRLGNGWMLHVTSTREEAAGYPPRGLSHFPDPVSAAIDEERRRFFEAQGQMYQSRFTLVVTWLPPALTQKKFTDLMFEDDRPAGDAREQTLSIIRQFKREISALESRLAPPFKLRRLRGRAVQQEDGSYLVYDELLEHLNLCATGKNHPVIRPRNPIYLDAVIGGQDLVTGVIPRVGRKFVQIITIDGFPHESSPGILTVLSELALEYRWTSRYVFLDRHEAVSLLKTYRKKWRQKMRGIFSQIFPNPNAYINADAKMMSEDAEEALVEIESGDTAGGYYTSVVVVCDDDRVKVEAAAKQIEKAINNAGFTARVESLNTMDALIGSLPGHGVQNVRRPYVSVFNLAHLIPTSSIWTGEQQAPCPMYPALSPALMQCVTKGHTPFRLNLHVRDLGHTMIFGPTGAGKSTFLALVIAQLRRYRDISIFVFDKGMSLYPLTAAAGGAHYTIAGDDENLAFCPLQFLETPSDKAWALEWIEIILALNGKEITPGERNEIAGALESLSRSHGNSLTHFLSTVQVREVQETLKQYTVEGSFGHLLDAENDSLALARYTTFEIEHLMNLGEKYALPVLLYLFRRIERLIGSQHGKPSVIVLDEAWLMLGHPAFRDKIREWLKTMRKANCAVVMATQSLSDAGRSGILDVIAESTPTKIFLPNVYARDEVFQELYVRLGLNKRQIELVTEASPKREYYVTSEKGRRLFELALGPLALAFCGASDKDTIAKIQGLEKKFGPEWIHPYLASRGLRLADYTATTSTP